MNLFEFGTESTFHPECITKLWYIPILKKKKKCKKKWIDTQPWITWTQTRLISCRKWKINKIKSHRCESELRGFVITTQERENVECQITINKSERNLKHLLWSFKLKIANDNYLKICCPRDVCRFSSNNSYSSWLVASDKLLVTFGFGVSVYNNISN